MSDPETERLDPVTLVARWSIWTPLAILALAIFHPVVSVFGVTTACSTVAACLILFLLAARTARKAFGEQRSPALVGAVIGAVLCGITGIVGIGILVLDSSYGGGPWRGSRSVFPYVLTLAVCAAYFVPFFRHLLPRLGVSRRLHLASLVLVLLALASPLPFVSSTWTRIWHPTLWKNWDTRNGFTEFLEEQNYIGTLSSLSPPSAEIRLHEGQTLTAESLRWLKEFHPDLELILKIRDGAEVESKALAEIVRLDIRECWYFPPDPDLEFTKAIVRCENLATLELRGRDLSAKHYRVLAEAKSLRSLGIGNSIQSDADLELIAQIRNLESLRLRGGGRVTDEGLRHLGHLENLRELEISYHRITGEGFVHLHPLRNLESVRLIGEAGVDPEWVEKLREALPDCRVWIGK